MMAAIDSNVWDLLTMPLGVLICFGPALAVWVRAELRTPKSEKRKE